MGADHNAKLSPWRRTLLSSILQKKCPTRKSDVRAPQVAGMKQHLRFVLIISVQLVSKALLAAGWHPAAKEKL